MWQSFDQWMNVLNLDLDSYFKTLTHCKFSSGPGEGEAATEAPVKVDVAALRSGPPSFSPPYARHPLHPSSALPGGRMLDITLKGAAPRCVCVLFSGCCWVRRRRSRRSC